jgi:hypothetical protein
MHQDQLTLNVTPQLVQSLEQYSVESSVISLEKDLKVPQSVQPQVASGEMQSEEIKMLNTNASAIPNWQLFQL